MRPCLACLRVGVVLAFAAAVPAAAQTGTITGRVVEAGTRAPVEGAIVRIHGTYYAAMTRANGAFTLVAAPPGVHTITVSRVGFASREVSGVVVRAGHTRSLPVELTPGSADTTTTVAAPRRLVEDGIVGAGVALGADPALAVLPRYGLADALALHSGYYRLPRRTGVSTLGDWRRGAGSLASVRGGRIGATQYLIDGIPVNNPVFGSPPVLLDPLAAGSVEYSPGYMDPRYGGGLAGLVQQTIREGGDRFAGQMYVQSTALAGALGSPVDRASGAYDARGYVAGPIPVGGGRVRFSVAGALRSSRESVLRIEDPATAVRSGANGALEELLGDTVARRPMQRQFLPWRGFGGDTEEQLVGKVVYSPWRNVNVTVTGLAHNRRVMGFDPRFATGFVDPEARTLIDSLALLTERPSQLVVPSSVRQSARLVAGRLERRFDRASVALNLARTTGERQTCNVWQGVCVMDRFGAPPPPDLPDGYPLPPGTGTPYQLTDLFFGGERYTTNTAWATAVVQATDHHQLQAGVSATRHALSYRETVRAPLVQTESRTATSRYRARPAEFAAYVQDAIEHDLLSLRIGIRFDQGHIGGTGFVNPLSPTNGTTAREVCDGQAPGINEVPFTYNGEQGIAACALSPPNARGQPTLLDSAARLAQQDDFAPVRPYVAASPRIAVSVPLTERSVMYANVGRYHKHPPYHDAYRNTGTGATAGLGAGTDGMCDDRFTRPGTNECPPTLLFAPDLPEYVGNPHIGMETSTLIEGGFSSQIGDVHVVDLTVFHTEHGRLASLVSANEYFDMGATYAPRRHVAYRTVLGYGHVGSLGVSVTLRRALAQGVAWYVNYSWLRSTEIGPPPELYSEGIASGDLPPPIANRYTEERSSRQQAHALNAVVRFNFRNRVPEALGRPGTLLLSNAQVAVALAAGSQTAPPLGGAASAPCGGGIVCRALAEAERPRFGGPLDLLYTRDFGSAGVRYALTVRLLNAFNAASGDAVPPRQQVANRRLLTGFGIVF